MPRHGRCLQPRNPLPSKRVHARVSRKLCPPTVISARHRAEDPGRGRLVTAVNGTSFCCGGGETEHDVKLKPMKWVTLRLSRRSHDDQQMICTPGTVHVTHDYHDVIGLREDTSLFAVSRFLQRPSRPPPHAFRANIRAFFSGSMCVRSSTNEVV